MKKSMKLQNQSHIKRSLRSNVENDLKDREFRTKVLGKVEGEVQLT